ncbi:hypothetical protein E4F37_07010 [Burkholderia pseudomallei]|nr:hypothetical protein E4F37_07010 [Burkholderia pseudomallei]
MVEGAAFDSGLHAGRRRDELHVAARESLSRRHGRSVDRAVAGIRRSGEAGDGAFRLIRSVRSIRSISSIRSIRSARSARGRRCDAGGP